MKVIFQSNESFVVHHYDGFILVFMSMMSKATDPTYPAII
jgi:hypothetical protein